MCVCSVRQVCVILRVIVKLREKVAPEWKLHPLLTDWLTSQGDRASQSVDFAKSAAQKISPGRPTKIFMFRI